MIESRECSVCGSSFQFVRTIGRPREKCSEACMREAARIHHKRYMRRLMAARDQLAALAA